jgi:hypothetical protein
MGHQNPDLDFDDTGHFLQGALCTIAAVPARKYVKVLRSIVHTGGFDDDVRLDLRN